VGAGHLNRKGAFDLIPGGRPLNQRQCGIHADFRNPAGGQVSRRLQLPQRRIDEITRAGAKGSLQPSPPSLGLAIRGTDLHEVRIDAPQLDADWRGARLTDCRMSRLAGHRRKRVARLIRHSVVPLLAKDCTRRAAVIGITWPVPEEIDDAELERRLFTAPSFEEKAKRPPPDWPQLHEELKRRGVTLMLLWQEYRADEPDGFGYSRFCGLYGDWRRSVSATMRQTHAAGEKLFVDYAGDTVPVIDPATDDARQAHVFVAALGASNFTYAEARWSEGLTGMAKALEDQRRQPDVATLPFEERLAMMIDREAIERENKRLERRLKGAGPGRARRHRKSSGIPPDIRKRNPKRGAGTQRARCPPRQASVLEPRRAAPVSSGKHPPPNIPTTR
jgi:hypothetical protein